MKRLAVVATAVLVLAAMAVGAEKPSYIKARGKPTGAGLFVDGNYIGPAGRFTVPEKYEVAPGNHEVTLRDPRYEEFTTRVTVQPGKTTKISYKMKKLPPPTGPFGRVRFGGDGPDSLTSIKEGDLGAVYVNDHFWGFVDELNNQGGGFLLTPGTYQIRAETRNFGVISQTVTVEPNSVTVIPLRK